ncbi:hypothetical protein VTI74DRAFT_10820 [Chaetomium olivicolor]
MAQSPPRRRGAGASSKARMSSSAQHSRFVSTPPRLSDDVNGDDPATALTPLLRRHSYRIAAELFCNERIYAVLLFVPVGLIVGAVGGVHELAVFALNFLAMVPLALLITMVVIKLSGSARPVLGGLLRSVLGNTVELLTGIVALFYGQHDLARRMVMGSVLSYSLLVLGGSFLCASYAKDHAVFERKQTSVMSTLVMLVSIVLVIPTIMVSARSQTIAFRDSYDDDETVLTLSRGISIILLLLFSTYVSFRFHTHPSVFQLATTLSARGWESHAVADPGLLSLSLVFLASATCAVGCTRYLILSLDGAFRALNMTKSFAGLILTPLLGNLGKAIVIISRSKRVPNLSDPIRGIMTNILDTLLFITPLLVLLGWIMNQPMALDFDSFEAIVFLLAMIILTYLLEHGKTTYFEGVMLIGTYFVLIVAFCVRT